MEAIQAIDWAMTEFGGAELGDVRRTRRLVAVASGVLMRPGGTVGSVFEALVTNPATATSPPTPQAPG